MSEYELFKEYALDPGSINTNLKVAEWYMDNDNTAAALTHYLKLTELLNEDENKDQLYYCLLSIAHIYKILGNRWLGVIQYCRFAKALDPYRPEAYFILADTLADKLYHDGTREQSEWIQVYENSKMGLEFSNVTPVEESKYYVSNKRLEAVYAISLLRLGKLDDLNDFLKVHSYFDCNDTYVMNTIIYIYNEMRWHCPYTHVMNEEPKLDWIGRKLDLNYSQSMQDVFALTVNRGKKNGLYLEIGSADPTYGSNTKLLESEFNWKGISVDFNIDFVNQFNTTRSNPAICADALKLDYSTIIDKYLDGATVIDYLSLDIDPAINTLNCLYRMPLDKVIFNCITFEHDVYTSDPEIRSKSREFLESKGYVLVGKDIKHDYQSPFEDWYVHNSVEGIDKLKSIFDESNGIPSNIFYNNK